jgi:hypothetical protein
VSKDDDVQFAMYDLQAMPVDRWQLADLHTINYYRAQFVASYNAKSGLDTVRPFIAGNCCIALKYGKKITVSGTKYDFQFPASASGQIQCNPSKGYNDARYSFYLLPTISEEQMIGEKEACVTKHNPAIFWRPTKVAPTPAPTPIVRPDTEFGLYDAQQTPPGGWHLMSLTDVQTHKAQFVAAYNKNGGFRAIKVFTANNCCIALKVAPRSRSATPSTVSSSPATRTQIRSAATQRAATALSPALRAALTTTSTSCPRLPCSISSAKRRRASRIITPASSCACPRGMRTSSSAFTTLTSRLLVAGSSWVWTTSTASGWSL